VTEGTLVVAKSGMPILSLGPHRGTDAVRLFCIDARRQRDATSGFIPHS